MAACRHLATAARVKTLLLAAGYLIVFTCLKPTSGGYTALQIRVIGFAAVAVWALSLNGTNHSMNAMGSVFSSVWFAVSPSPDKNGEKVDWPYQLAVNLARPLLGGIMAVFVTGLFRPGLQRNANKDTFTTKGVLFLYSRI